MEKYLIINEQILYNNLEIPFEIFKASILDNYEYLYDKKYIVFPNIYDYYQFLEISKILNCNLLYNLNKNQMIDFLKYTINQLNNHKIYFEGPNNVGKSFYLNELSKYFNVVKNENSKKLSNDLKHLYNTYYSNFYISKYINQTILYDRSFLSLLIYNKNPLPNLFDINLFDNHTFYFIFIPKNIEMNNIAIKYKNFYEKYKFNNKILLIDFYEMEF